MKPRLACILAAGVGSRLRPLTDDKPKALVPVSGRTILARAVDHLVAFGVKKLVIATGYREDALRRALANVPVEVVYRPNPDYATTQNSVSLALCRDVLSTEDFLRLDGDVVFDPEILSRLAAVDAPLVAAVDRARMLDAEAMKVRLEPDGLHVQSFGKAIPLSESGGESIGIELVRKDASGLLFAGLDRAISGGETGLYYEDVYSRLVPAGLRVGVADVTGVRWCEVDSPEDLENASRLFPA
ncbi:MAG TPA: phosphocholine cytidylyltransferase family protein [Polyangiaceae bacterium]|nr:phosphocholine cytidylyltransferase family protein [Polyangiaceae bacterium]